MPTIPTVFRSIRKNDVTHKPFKAYKNYRVDNDSYSSQGYRLQKAYHFSIPPTIGDTTTDYVLDSNFNSSSNMHVVWNSLDHKYYRYPYDPAKTLELSNRETVEKFLFYSASTFAMPYGSVGERIKPESLSLTSNIKNYQDVSDYSVNLIDDGLGNLRDIAIDSSSFANKNNLQFYLSSNNEYRRFSTNFGLIHSSSIEYRINKNYERAYIQNVEIRKGVTTHVGSSDYIPSGLSGYFTSSKASYIRVNDNKMFNNFNNCDHWGISFWINPAATDITGTILSKGKVKNELYLDPSSQILKTRDIVVDMPQPGVGDFSQYKTPFQISLHDSKIHFQSSNGSNQLHISASASYRNNWMHVLVYNSSSLCRIAINGNDSGTSGSLPADNTSNTSYVFVGAHSHLTGESFQGEIAEMRIYDYALKENQRISLSNQNFYSGSLYQTSVAGNCFYRNGQLVVSSPLPKYDNIFVSSSNLEPTIFDINYRGTHTIYENEVMVRVPRGACNVSVNPSSTFRPSTGNPNNCNISDGDSERFNSPGDFRKTMFLSGSALPYITTIGLYDDDAQLLAVGKLAEPVQKRNDIDMNFIVRWDY